MARAIDAFLQQKNGRTGGRISARIRRPRGGSGLRLLGDYGLHESGGEPERRLRL
jgi:hypothetical protein